MRKEFKSVSEATAVARRSEGSAFFPFLVAGYTGIGSAIAAVIAIIGICGGLPATQAGVPMAPSEIGAFFGITSLALGTISAISGYIVSRTLDPAREAQAHINEISKQQLAKARP